jgi:ubiquinone/menaquinone biosynthesis C-methylase UbiE
VTAEQYDAWHDTPRGRWIGELEWTAVRNALRLQPSDTVLDVGCGTGWFTRRAESVATRVVGLDIDRASLDFARRKGAGRADYVTGDATCLPFADAAFDKVMSIAALCFVSDWPRAIAEIARVCRDHFAIGLLNRHSLLYLRKGQHGGIGAYAGAHWHTKAELEASMRALQFTRWRISYGVFAASGGTAARLVERAAPETLPFGSFLLLAGQRGPGLVSSAR